MVQHIHPDGNPLDKAHKQGWDMSTSCIAFLTSPSPAFHVKTVQRGPCGAWPPYHGPLSVQASRNFSGEHLDEAMAMAVCGLCR